MSPFTPETDASEVISAYSSNVVGKTILATGVTSGSIGAGYVEAVAKASPACLILAGRSPTKLAAEAEVIASLDAKINIKQLVVDLSDLSNVRKAAHQVNSWEDVKKVDVVMNCAGIMAWPFELTKDGHEMHFAANHLGHFLLINLIIDKVLKSEDPRVLNITSAGHRLGYVRWADLTFENGKNYKKWQAYGQSKSANMLMAVSLAEKLGKKGLLACSIHPGLVMASSLTSHLDMTDPTAGDFVGLTQAWKDAGDPVGFADAFATGKIVVKSPSQGAATAAWASFAPEARNHNGGYLQDCHVTDPMEDIVRPWATDPVEAERLWRLSEELVGQKFQF